MTTVVEKALGLWGMPGATVRLIAARENRVFRVDHGGQSFALRLHREGYRQSQELWSELQWMAAVSAGGVHVPAPVASQAGQVLHTIDGTQVDLLTWLTGQPLGDALDQATAAEQVTLFRRIGAEMAQLHVISDAWERPDGFTRRHWDRAGLLGEKPLWGRFWDNPTLSRPDRAFFKDVRQEADMRLRAVMETLDYGLIHADLVRENVLIDAEQVQLIDFDDAGFGFRLFELATLLLKTADLAAHDELRAALLAGYGDVRTIDSAPLDLFLLLRALTYVGWIAARLDEENAQDRNARYVETARALALRVL